MSAGGLKNAAAGAAAVAARRGYEKRIRRGTRRRRKMKRRLLGGLAANITSDGTRREQHSTLSGAACTARLGGTSASAAVPKEVSVYNKGRVRARRARDAAAQSGKTPDRNNNSQSNPGSKLLDPVARVTEAAKYSTGNSVWRPNCRNT
jgi:hypothetical protein